MADDKTRSGGTSSSTNTDSKDAKMDTRTKTGGTTGTSGGPPPPPPGPSTLPPLRILSWNVFLLPDPVQSLDHKKRATMIGDYLKARRGNFDIICIEKAFQDTRRQIIVDALKPYFPHVVDPLLAVKWKRWFGDYNSGITVLSKVPLQTLVRHDWNEAAGTEASEPKGYVILELVWHGQPVQLVVVHMQGHLKDDEKEAKVRAAQMLELKDGLVSERRANVTQIICGDFAIKAGTTEYDQLRSQLELDHPFSNSNLYSTTEFMRKDFPNIKSKISGTELSDYFFLRNSTSVELGAIKRGLLEDATGAWLSDLNKDKESLSYKTPMTAEVILQPTAHRPAAPVDFVTGASQTTYLSFIQEQPERSYTSFVYHPQNSAGMEYGLAELKGIVREARANGKAARAMGSGHSFSHVARAAHPTKGTFLVDIGGGVADVEKRADTGINGIQVLANNDPRLNSSWVSTKLPAGHRLVELGAGTTVKMLNEQLEAQKLGLINMGTYNGQTFAGASSTSTHGSGIKLPPFPDMIRSLVLVSNDEAGNPRAYRIEPSGGITNPAKFVPTQVDELIQNDDIFYSAICAMGSFGLLHSFIIEVRPFYYLDENNDITTWKEIKAMGIDAFKKDVAKQRHFELVVAPHTDDKVGGDLLRFKNEIPVVRVRREVSTSTTEKGLKRGCLFSLAEMGSGLFTDEAVAYPKTYRSDYKTSTPPFPLGVKGESFPFNLSNMISPTGYTNKYYGVFRQGGHTIGGYAVELTAPIDKTFDVLDRILAVCAYNRAQGNVHSSPIGVRFVSASNAYLSQFYGRDSVTFEVTMLRGTPGGYNALRTVQDAFLGDPDIRMHWGLTMVPQGDGSGEATGFRTLDHWRARFPKFDVWLANYRRFNAHGLFSSDFTHWMGLETPPGTATSVAGSLSVLVHLADFGDMRFQGDAFAGTKGQSRQLEGFQLNISPAIPGVSLRYMAHLAGYGDVAWVNEGQFMGTRGQSRRLEGFAIELTGPNAGQYKISYMAHLAGIGDTAWVEGGTFCGTKGESRRVEGLAVRIERR